MDYFEFKEINDKIKALNPKVGHLDFVDIKNGRCVFSINGIRSNLSIAQVVSQILNGNGSVSNPSALSQYNFNSKPNDSNMFYRKSDNIVLCHGSKAVVETPHFGGGSSDNDYGSGFYCVLGKNKELAKEWSCSVYGDVRDGVVNSYSFNPVGMNILNLDKLDIIYWVVMTACYRNVSVNDKYLNKLKSKFLIDVSQYDCIYGWRCDDSFSHIIGRFFNEQLSCEAVYEAIHLGNLQQQFVLKSRRAFDNIKFIESEKVSYEIYSKRFVKRKDEVDSCLNKCQRMHRNGKYIYDYLEEV